MTSTAGYSIHQDVLTASECDELIVRLRADRLKYSRAGCRHLMANHAVAALASDRRLVDLAEAVLGSHAIPYRATLFRKHRRELAGGLASGHGVAYRSRVRSEGLGSMVAQRSCRLPHAPAWALERIVALRFTSIRPTVTMTLRILAGSHRAGVLTDQQVFGSRRPRAPL